MGDLSPFSTGRLKRGLPIGAIIGIFGNADNLVCKRYPSGLSSPELHQILSMSGGKYVQGEPPGPDF